MPGLQDLLRHRGVERADLRAETLRQPVQAGREQGAGASPRQMPGEPPGAGFGGIDQGFQDAETGEQRRSGDQRAARQPICGGPGAVQRRPIRGCIFCLQRAKSVGLRGRFARAGAHRAHARIGFQARLNLQRHEQEDAAQIGLNRADARPQTPSNGVGYRAGGKMHIIARDDVCTELAAMAFQSLERVRRSQHGEEYTMWGMGGD